MHAQVLEIMTPLKNAWGRGPAPQVERRGWRGETGVTARGAENSDGCFLDQD